MKVKLLAMWDGYEAGRVVDVIDNVAESLIRHGIAVDTKKKQVKAAARDKMVKAAENK